MTGCRILIGDALEALGLGAARVRANKARLGPQGRQFTTIARKGRKRDGPNDYWYPVPTDVVTMIDQIRSQREEPQTNPPPLSYSKRFDNDDPAWIYALYRYARHMIVEIAQNTKKEVRECRAAPSVATAREDMANGQRAIKTIQRLLSNPTYKTTSFRIARDRNDAPLANEIYVEPLLIDDIEAKLAALGEAFGDIENFLAGKKDRTIYKSLSGDPKTAMSQQLVGLYRGVTGTEPTTHIAKMRQEKPCFPLLVKAVWELATGEKDAATEYQIKLALERTGPQEFKGGELRMIAHEITLGKRTTNT